MPVLGESQELTHFSSHTVSSLKDEVTWARSLGLLGLEEVRRLLLLLSEAVFFLPGNVLVPFYSVIQSL